MAATATERRTRGINRQFTARIQCTWRDFLRPRPKEDARPSPIEPDREETFFPKTYAWSFSIRANDFRTGEFFRECSWFYDRATMVIQALGEES